MKLALFKSMEYGYISAQDDAFEDMKRHVRISEYVDVDFPPLEDKDIVTKQVSILEQAKKDIQAQTEIELNDLDRKIGELLALPHIKEPEGN